MGVRGHLALVLQRRVIREQHERGDDSRKCRGDAHGGVPEIAEEIGTRESDAQREQGRRNPRGADNLGDQIKLRLEHTHIGQPVHAQFVTVTHAGVSSRFSVHRAQC